MPFSRLKQQRQSTERNDDVRRSYKQVIKLNDIQFAITANGKRRPRSAIHYKVTTRHGHVPVITLDLQSIFRWL